jgi:predicted secreted protein
VGVDRELQVGGARTHLDREYALGDQLAGAGPDDPEVPNEIVAKILQDISRGRPITRGHLSLDMPAAAEDGRVVPAIIESDLPMTAERYVKAVHLVVDFNPDAHLAVYELSPAIGTVSL